MKLNDLSTETILEEIEAAINSQVDYKETACPSEWELIGNDRSEPYEDPMTYCSANKGRDDDFHPEHFEKDVEGIKEIFANHSDIESVTLQGNSYDENPEDPEHNPPIGGWDLTIERN